jgi:hypothetical protein
MPLEQTGPINTLNPAWPVGADGVNTTDDHLRLIKDDLITNLPNLGGVVTASHEDLNTLAGTATNGGPINPVGTVLQGVWTSAPDGYLDCDGSAINALYTELIALVGANTPDLRGRFIRAWNTGQVDPSGSRTPLDEQDYQVQAHDHPMPHTHSASYAGFPGTAIEGGNNYGAGSQSTGQPSTPNTSNAGGAETRPVNTTLRFVIKW